MEDDLDVGDDEYHHIEQLDGWGRYGDWTYIAYQDGERVGLVRLSDQDAFDGVLAHHLVTGTRDEALACLREWAGDDEDLAYEVQRPDGTSFLVVNKTMYAIVNSDDDRIFLLELTDFDLIEGELAVIVHTAPELDNAKREFNRLTQRRQAGHPPVLGRLAKQQVLADVDMAMAGRSAGEFVVRERCGRCGARVIVGAPHDCR